ncbi:hypothetical protein [Clostridium sp.]|uniref:hypothetical protein n=1 Tax=Clostridium sp. TaxID=1506 RepID=UPI002637D695|nr:hypothetical protein [Clostridium sp.]
MSEDKNNYRILNFFDLDLISNIVLNKIEETKGCEFLFNDDCNIYNILNKVLESFLINFNRTLLISDNIEEIYEHTEIINSLNENIYDVSKKHNIEKKLRNQIANLQDNTGKTLLSKIEVLNRRIEKNTSLLNKIITFFYNKDNEGLNLVDKYYITEKLISDNEKYSYYYKIFRIKKPFENLTYYKIKYIKEEIEKRSLIPIYTTYRRYLDNSRFKVLQKNAKTVLVQEALKELDKINKSTSIKINYYNLKYKKEFISNFIINQEMNLIELEELVDIVNMKYNNYLLEKKVDTSFFRFFKSNKKEIENKNNEKYNCLKKGILEDFNNMYSNTKLEISKFRFLYGILTKEEYDSFILMLIKGEEVKEKVELYYKLLKLSINIEEVKINVESLDNDIKDVLEYCYDSIEYKNDLVDIISNIHKIKLYYEIENIEISNEDIICEYKNFDAIKESIYNDIKIRDLLVKKSIKPLWDNLIRETYKFSNFNIDKIDYDDKETFKNITPIVLTDDNKIFEDDIFSEINSFDKVVLFNTKKSLDIEKIKVNIQKDKLIVFTYKDKEVINLKEEINIVDLNKVKEVSIKYKYINYNILEYIIPYIINNGYILNENYNYKEDIYKLIICKLDTNKKVGLIIDTEIFNYKDNYYIKELYLRDIEKDFFIYRIWNRDMWINRNKVIKELLEYLKEVLQ